MQKLIKIRANFGAYLADVVVRPRKGAAAANGVAVVHVAGQKDIG